MDAALAAARRARRSAGTFLDTGARATGYAGVSGIPWELIKLEPTVQVVVDPLRAGQPVEAPLTELRTVVEGSTGGAVDRVGRPGGQDGRIEILAGGALPRSDAAFVRFVSLASRRTKIDAP